MQTVRKKTRHTGEKRRFLLLTAALMLLAAVGVAGLILTREDAPVAAERVDPTVSLTQYTASEVASITIRRGDEAPWTAENTADLALVLQGEDGFALTPAESADLLEAARVIVAEEVLTDDPAEYVRSLLKNDNAELTIEVRDEDNMTIFADCNGMNQKFLFTKI